jgi:putative ABC transport system permease protein
MRFTDLVALVFSALRQQKVRTALTLLGVAIGTFVLLLSLSIGQGVREAIVHEFHRNDQLRRILIWPTWKPKAEEIPPQELVVKGEMSEARRERLRQAIIRHWQFGRRSLRQALTPQRLQEFAALDHVEAVIPRIGASGRIHFHNRRRQAYTLSALPDERPYRRRLVAGSFFTAEQPRGVVVNEYLLYLLGVENEAEVDRVVGSDIELEYKSREGNYWSVLALMGARVERVEPGEEDVLAKVAKRLLASIDHLDLTAAEKETLRKMAARSQAPSRRSTFEIRETFRVVGVIRDPTDEERLGGVLWSGPGGDQADVLVPVSTLQELFFRVPEFREAGVDQVTIVVDSEDNVEAVEQRIRDLGFNPQSLATILKNLRLNVLLITFATTFVAVVALVVAGLGITNTLLMSVLERTREIGIMKAVGAREVHVQLMFLLEGAWIGLLGSGVGLLCGWLASLPGDRIARRLAEQQAQTHLSYSLFAFPWWLVVGVPLFVTLLTMLAAVYPARRAARVNPMTALRHE